MTFGEKIKKLRADNKITQEELAQKVFVTRTAVSKWESNTGYPSIDVLKLLASTFHTSIDELFTDDDVRSKKLYDDKIARRSYWGAFTCAVLAAAFALGGYLGKIAVLGYVGIGAIFGYVVLAYFAKPKYKRLEWKSLILRVIILALVTAVVILVIVGP